MKISDIKAGHRFAYKGFQFCKVKHGAPFNETEHCYHHIDGDEECKPMVSILDIKVGDCFYEADEMILYKKVSEDMAQAVKFDQLTFHINKRSLKQVVPA